MAVCLEMCVWPPAMAHTVGLMASLFLSTSQPEGARFREVQSLDIGTETLLPKDTAPMKAVTAFAAVILTGYALTRPEGGLSSPEVRVSLPSEQSQRPSE